MQLKSLGRNTQYFEEYNPHLLEPISRHLSREGFIVDTSKGYDLWRLYEITYLNSNSIPQVCVGEVKVLANSPCIIESKSLKLYILSLTQTKFASREELTEVIKHDLSKATDSIVEVNLYDLNSSAIAPKVLPGKCIDRNYDFFKVNFNEIDKSVLCFDEQQSALDAINEDSIKIVHSNILRTLCPVTSQPDHGSVIIAYRGNTIKEQSLFTYLCSYRKHQGFHEQCTESIYNDIKSTLNIPSLYVQALFTRRGGIDINPVRADEILLDGNLRALRQ